jgi:SRSO17 transposase
MEMDQMGPRYELRRRELMEDCRVEPAQVARLAERLREFAKPFAGLLGHSQQRGHMGIVLEGMLSDLDRKTTEPIAYRHDLERRPLQWFMGDSFWDPAPLRMELARKVGQEFAESDGVIVFDPSAHPKKGEHSVGVARQWCGRLGKVENCQVGVYMGYATRKGHALVDTRLSLPRAWAKDRKRRKKCGIPPEVKYQTRHDLALEMLDEKGDLLPHAWITGDDELGRPSRFRADLRARGERYLLAVPSNTLVRDLEGEEPAWSGQGRKPRPRFQRCAVWAATIPASAWQKIDVRDGEQGPLIVTCVKRRVQARGQGGRVGPEELLLATRTPQGDGTWKHDYFLSNATSDVQLEELARVVKAEHRIEESFQRAKSEAGLSQYEVRSWIGWYHHQTLSMIATWFLTIETSRGKKGHAGVDGTADRGRAGMGAARTECFAQADRLLSDPTIATQRGISLAPLAIA